jgi:hypothetical protein
VDICHGRVSKKGNIQPDSLCSTGTRGGDEGSGIFKECPTVDLEYNVFIFFVNYTRPQQNEFTKKFFEEKQKTNVKKALHQPYKRTFDENDFMSFDTLEEFNTRKRWKLIVDNVIKNPEFYSCISSLNRKTFSIK